MFGFPASSPYDWRFRLLGMPVRVTPWFWIVSAILGISAVRGNFGLLLVWVPCVFVSIMIHELGHALVAKMFGFYPSIELHGGFGATDSQADRQTRWQRLAVLMGGPAAGFMAFGAFFGISIWLGDSLSSIGSIIIGFLQMINLMWTLFNILPVIPLDGGQIVSVVLSMFSRRSGHRWALVISLICASLLAAFFFSRTDLWMAFLFAYFALLNYQELQILYQHAKYGYDHDDADWWRQ